MRETVRTYAVIGGVAVCALFAALNSPTNGEAPKQTPQKWEYVSETVNAGTFSPQFLNDRGRQGWELVATPSTKDTIGYVFKRPIN
jgi:hypothetical protein